MGSPISGTIAELMIQHIENQHIKHLIETGNITYYTRYVDDIFIIYNSTKTTIEEIQSYTNHIHKNLKFAITQENNKQLNFLDILNTRQEQKLDINMHRKNTTTDTTINYLSNHPMEHKIAAYRYYINRMKKLPLNKKTGQWNGKPYSG
jgi:organic radical activating enzyme